MGTEVVTGSLLSYLGGTKPDLIKLGDERPDNVAEKVDLIPVPEIDPLHGIMPIVLINCRKQRVSTTS